MPAVLERKTIQVNSKCESDFRPEYKKDSPDQAVFNDIVSYLGEYRFKIPKFKYKLKFSDGELRELHKQESMSDISQRALNQKMMQNKNCSRELAEKRGIESLNNHLTKKQDEGTVVWMSPPGPKEEGYGDYGFIFVGNIKQKSSSEKIVQMTAIRIENPHLEQFNQAMQLFTGEKTGYKTPEEFISKPKVVGEHLEEGYVDELLGKVFSFKPDEEGQGKFNTTMQKMSPLIWEFVRSVKDPFKSKEEKIKELYALENYALQLKEEYDYVVLHKEKCIIDFKPEAKLADISITHGHEPPKVAGSCPGSNDDNSFTSSNTFNRNSFLNNLLGIKEVKFEYEFDQDGPCKNCNADVKCGPCGICRACDLEIREGQKFGLN